MDPDGSSWTCVPGRRVRREVSPHEGKTMLRSLFRLSNDARARWQRALPRAVVLLLCLAPIVPQHQAAAQAGGGIVAGPITTRRFERHVQSLMQATPDEMRALDRLHEKYLERFRAEIDPELSAWANHAMGAPLHGPEYERRMREVARIATRVTEADAAFFNAAVEVLSEAGRAGFARVRAARERQRLLSGMAKLAPSYFGSGTNFVDLVDLVARPEYTDGLSPEARAQFHAFVATQEARLLTQARTVSSESGEAFAKWYALSMAEAEPDAAVADPAEPAGEQAAEAEAQRRMMDRAARTLAQSRELGQTIRKTIRANHADNQAACAQLAAILGVPRTDRLRVFVAVRALGSMALEVGEATDDGGDTRAAVMRIRRDPRLSDDDRARIDALVAAWDAARAPLYEKLLDLIDDSALPSWMGGWAAMDETSPEAAAFARVERESEALRGKISDAGQRLLEGLASVLGDLAAGYVHRVPEYTEDGEERPGDGRWSMRSPKASADGAEGVEAEAPLAVGMYVGDTTPMPARPLIDALRLCGREELIDLAKEVHESWQVQKWEPRMDTLAERLSEFFKREWGDSADGLTPTPLGPKEVAERSAIQREMTEARWPLEETLLADVAGALGLDAAGAEVRLMRLSRANRVEGAPDVTRVLVRAKATPDEVRAIVASSGEGEEETPEQPAGWSAAIAALEEGLRQIAAGDLRQTELQHVYWAAPDATTARAMEELGAIARESAELRRKLASRLSAQFTAALEAAITDEARRAEFRRIERQLAHPEVYDLARSAERQLDAALALGGLDEDLRARIDALRAEYIAVYDTLSARMVELASVQYDYSDPTGFDAYAKRLQECERLDFDRGERTSKALGELRRLLGADRAARVPGLAEEVREEGRSPWDMMSDED